MERPGQPESIDALWIALREQREQAREQQERTDARAGAQDARIADLEAQLQRARLEKAEMDSRAAVQDRGSEQEGRGLSRAGLLKAAAVGLAGVAGAGALGVGSPETALASSDTYFSATGLGGGGTGFYASSSAAFSYGVQGFGNSNGVYGNSSSIGVYGNGSSGSGIGVYGFGGSYGGQFSGILAPLRLAPGSSSGTPTTGPHQPGELYVDINGVFYICTAAGSPGTWKRLATTDLGLQSFSSPQRVFNFSMTNGQVCNPVSVTWVGVPAGARSAYCAVQAIPTSAGPLTLFPAGASDPGFANWTAVQPNVLNLSYMLVPLSSSGQFQIHSYINGPVYVDVWGYLL